ncbi:hypothetical protein RMCBS344292_14616 [Rhizopus microsporus]|nr:hypothetical protein RMCBS344292_14616 [Rhizopus microsporus]
MNAEACLDSAIKSATSIYNNNNVNSKVSFIRRPSTTSTNSNGVDTVSSTEKRASNARLSTTRIRYKPDTKHILRKLDNLLRELELDSGKFFSTIGTTDDYEVLQKAYVDLDIAKTISLSAKSNMKRRNILMRSARRRNNLDEIKTANIGLPRVRTTSVTQHSTKPVTSPISPGKNVSTTIASHVAATNATAVVTNASSTTSQQKKITTPSSSTATGTSDSSAIPDAGKKSLLKPPSQRGPGSTLRLRSMLAKRSSALKPPTAVSNSST